MLIQLKNKDTLIIDDFKLKCCIGKKGILKKKIEGDKSTPKGTFELIKLYYRADRVKKPLTLLKKKKIHKNMGWCDDPKSKLYNKEIKISKNLQYEILYRKDYKYNYFIELNYNKENTVSNKGSAIFIHLTNNYKPTLGCIALKEKDFIILLKLIGKKNKLKIN